MKHETEYAYAVARVRANELSLLSAQDIEQLISTENYKQVIQSLSEKGWGDATEFSEISKYLQNHMKKTWGLFEETLDDIHELDMLVIKNDMQNLKAALKSTICKHEPNDLYVAPTVYNTDEVVKAVKERDFESLPECMRDVAAEAYDILTRTKNGQIADAILDTRTLELILKFGNETKSGVLSKLAEIMVATANIKTALRCANTGKNKEFVQNSICECKTLDKNGLVKATLDGVDSVKEFVSKTDYKEAIEKFEESTTAFEKWCDDKIMECVMPAKYKPFGLEPIAAYYIAKEAEIKTVRIILSAKLNHLQADIIRERVRELYV